jgi:uncharacterized protein YneF (UPF0154 family)
MNRIAIIVVCMSVGAIIGYLFAYFYVDSVLIYDHGGDTVRVMLVTVPMFAMIGAFISFFINRSRIDDD